MVARSFPDDRALGAAIVAAAEAWIGTPYRHQGMRRGVGCDCLGLVLGIWADVFGSAPDHPRRYSADWAEVAPGDPLLAACRQFGREVPDPPDAGMILVFRWQPGVACKHLAVATGPGTMIHAREGHAVCRSPIGSPLYRRLAGKFRFPLTFPQE